MCKVKFHELSDWIDKTRKYRKRDDFFIDDKEVELRYRQVSVDVFHVDVFLRNGPCYVQIQWFGTIEYREKEGEWYYIGNEDQDPRFKDAEPELLEDSVLIEYMLREVVELRKRDLEKHGPQKIDFQLVKKKVGDAQGEHFQICSRKNLSVRLKVLRGKKRNLVSTFYNRECGTAEYREEEGAWYYVGDYYMKDLNRIMGIPNTEYLENFLPIRMEDPESIEDLIEKIVRIFFSEAAKDGRYPLNFLEGNE
jgi:hypothetical protein